MYLKALEIQGFKSFPDKTVLTFGEDITAIVGPNGSGKSNISDAICWVMGEQSTRALRGGKMEDVIFGGTQRRGQVGFAQVSLIIDNQAGILPVDESEVMVTRRYYRSGESEYYINRRGVRLKDINELFMDTGLGREGYSIIGQGKIDEILSVKSEERREIFEEAAGISKFRHRKEEAERKLERTEDDLLRVGDKIAELELQVEPLREQAAKAKRFLILRDELRGLEVSVWLEELEKLRAAAIRLLGESSAAQSQLENGNRRLEELYAAAEALAGQMREKDREAEAAREEISGLQTAAAEAESAVSVLRNNMENNRQNAERVREEICAQETRETGLSAQIQERTDRLTEIGERRAVLEEELRALLGRTEEAARSAGNSANEGQTLRSREALELAAAADGRAKLSALEAAFREMEGRRTALDGELDRLRERQAAAEAAEAEAKNRLTAVREEADSLINTLTGYQMRVAAREKRAGEARERKEKLELEQKTLRARIHLLSEMEKEYEGFSKAVRIVMQEAERGRLKNIHGPVASLIRAGDDYTVAVETAMGAALQNIVVDREEDGKAAISVLKARDGGRATFLPLSSVRGYELRENGLEREPGFVGVAAGLVEFDPKYGEIVGNLLGRTVVVENMDAAISMARKHAYRFRIVTLDGQILNPGGSMTGGSASRSAGILSRANELERLAGREKALNAELSAAEKEFEEAKRTAEAARYELEVAGADRRRLEDEILKLEGECARHGLLSGELQKSRAALEEERAELERRKDAEAGEAETLRTELAGREAAAAEYRARAEASLSRREELDRLGGKLAEEISGLKSGIAGLDAEKEATEKSMRELETLRADLTGDREERLRRVREYETRNQEVQAEIRSRTEALEALRRAAEEKQGRLRAISGERLELEAERTRRDRESQEKNREILGLERECARLEQKKTAADLEEKQLLDRLWEHYELSHSAAQAVRVELESVPKANRRIGELKKEISSLGTPNIGAISEFERVNTRYEYLTGQRADVERSKIELEEIIAGITGEMKRIFAEQFQKINEGFQTTFVELFGGGSAALELENEADILNCGIEIKVQPPGKSLRTISLLSGGEKAFAAIALYFSILKVRPTPFCVMDEIEAALDDANVVRFARYLRMLTDKTQFIVITHRRGTMEEADVLYGVTMQEQGVSRMLNINLNDMARELQIG